MSSRARLWVVGALLLASGCSTGPSANDWTIRFATDDIRARTRVIVATIHQGDCAGTALYSTELRTDGSAIGARMPPPVLPEGSYSLAALGRDPVCMVSGYGCQPVSLPRDGAVVVTLAESPPPRRACRPGETCMPGGSGICMSGLDAGGDAGSDAGPPTCSMEGMTCPSGGICRSGGCCIGCWDGMQCGSGTEAVTCGPAGGSCTACPPGNACRGGACVDEASAVQFSLSAENSFVRRPDGHVWGAGRDIASQLGPRGGSTDGTRFVQYSGPELFAQIASGQNGTCGVTITGAIFCWGVFVGGPTPVSVGGENQFNQIAAGSYHFCTIRSDGLLFCFGDNTPQGRLGTGDTMGGPTPRPVRASATWSRVSCGSLHTCGIQSDRSLWCWGSDATEQLGNGTRGDALMPDQVGTDTDWLEVSAGVAHTCAIKLDGSLWCWGEGGSNRLGLGTDVTRRPSPIQLAGPTGWTSVAAGQFHTCGVRSGEGFCWGSGLRGELGIPGPQGTPASIGMGWSRIWTGWTHTCGVQGGMLFCWGGNMFGEIGVGDMMRRDMPTAITLP